MGQSLSEISTQLRTEGKKLQLIYAFNGSGKTRLSREFRRLVSLKDIAGERNAENEEGIKVLYYDAYTEDLFYWDNDSPDDSSRKLIIHPNGFTNLVLNFLREQGLDGNIASNFQRYTSDKLTPRFNEEYTKKDKDNRDVIVRAYSEITFSIEAGNNESFPNVKISKGEESNFIWCVFYSLLEQIVEVLNVPESEERVTNQFDNLEYIFIDDPVSSLDDTHLIELAVNIAELIKSSPTQLKFIITTHNPLFYNVIFNEFNRTKNIIKKRLEKLDDGTFSIEIQPNDSPFSYHLFLLSELEKAIQSENIQKYHFNFLRNVLEKTSTFLGYNKWEDLLPQDSRQAYFNRIINLSSHSKHNGEEVSIIDENDKRVIRYLVSDIKTRYLFKSNVNPSVNSENVTV